MRLPRLSFLRFAILAPFEFADCALGERWVAVEIIGIEDGAYVAETMACDGRDLRHGAARKGEARDGSAAEIVEGQPHDAGSGAGLAPARPKPVFGPRLVIGADQDKRAALWRGVERGL